eukprot:9685142-Prorocentrum_lima.AAC.1
MKEELIGRIKQHQRSGWYGREAWARYCDERNCGTRDPRKHAVEALREFLGTHEGLSGGGCPM